MLDLNINIDEVRYDRKSYTGGSQLRSALRSPMEWYLWCLTASVSCMTFGVYWDISWHVSIGRDSFFTPPHTVEYLAGLMVAIACGYAILSATFAEFSPATVSIWPFRGPLGCFVAVWGGALMLFSGPFDNWWHSAYGLDVLILSPPHVLLFVGMMAVLFGTIQLAAVEANRVGAETQPKRDALVLYLGGIALFFVWIITMEETFPQMFHTSYFYETCGLAFPGLILAIATLSRSSWPASTMVGVYTIISLLALWILPLFPARPRLGPVFQNITHMVPLGFPLLLILPSIAIDLLKQQVEGKWSRIRAAGAYGSLFFFLLLISEWPFGGFLLSPAARNRIFGQAYFAYNDQANITYSPYGFWSDQTNAALAKGLAIALASAMVASLIGIVIGGWLRRTKR